MIIRLFMLSCFACAVAACTPKPRPEMPASVSASEAARLHAMGVALGEQGDLTRAEQYLVSALRSGHDERASVRALVSVCVRASRLRSALAYGSAYLQTHPKDHALRKLLATLHFALGELVPAERELRTVLAGHEQDPDAHYVLAIVLSHAPEDPDRARTHFARYLELAPTGAHAEEARAALDQAG